VLERRENSDYTQTRGRSEQFAARVVALVSLELNLGYEFLHKDSYNVFSQPHGLSSLYHIVSISLFSIHNPQHKLAFLFSFILRNGSYRLLPPSHRGSFTWQQLCPDGGEAKCSTHGLWCSLYTYFFSGPSTIVSPYSETGFQTQTKNQIVSRVAASDQRQKGAEAALCLRSCEPFFSADSWSLSVPPFRMKRKGRIV
jgi:hypothetical protein